MPEELKCCIRLLELFGAFLQPELGVVERFELPVDILGVCFSWQSKSLACTDIDRLIKVFVKLIHQLLTCRLREILLLDILLFTDVGRLGVDSAHEMLCN